MSAEPAATGSNTVDDTQQEAAAAGRDTVTTSNDLPGVYCPVCVMWLNELQWDEHLQGRKHFKNVRRAARAERRQQEAAAR